MNHSMVILIFEDILAYHIPLRREKCPLQNSGIVQRKC